MKAIVFFVLLLVAPALGDTTAKLRLAPKPPEKITVEMVKGCPICCCRIAVPKGISKHEALKECLRSAPEYCRKACEEWLKNHPETAKTKKGGSRR